MKLFHKSFKFFWLRQELKERSYNLRTCPSLSFWLRFLSLFVGQTEPKILRLVLQRKEQGLDKEFIMELQFLNGDLSPAKMSFQEDDFVISHIYMQSSAAFL